MECALHRDARALVDSTTSFRAYKLFESPCRSGGLPRKSRDSCAKNSHDSFTKATVSAAPVGVALDGHALRAIPLVVHSPFCQSVLARFRQKLCTPAGLLKRSIENRPITALYGG